MLSYEGGYCGAYLYNAPVSGRVAWEDELSVWSRVWPRQAALETFQQAGVRPIMWYFRKKQTKQIMLNWSPAQHGDRHHPSDGDHLKESLRGQSLVLRDLQPPYLCNWQQAWDVVRKYFAFWSCEILTLLCILVYCSRSTPTHWVLALSDQNGRTWPRNGGWFFLKFHNKLFKVM